MLRTALLTTCALLALPAGAMAIPASGGSAVVAAEAAEAAVGGRAATAPVLARAAGTTISARRIDGFGTVLVDGRGLPLYAFTADRGTTSRCYDACSRAWPVTFAKGTPRAGDGVRQALLGTTRRSDGRRQVTYRGRPLYAYVDDRPGVALCHGVREFGGLWLLVRGSGKLVA